MTPITRTVRRLALRGLPLAFALTTGLSKPGILAAQGGDEYTPGPAGCAITAQLLLVPPAVDRYGRLLNRAHECANAVEMYVSAWSAAPSDRERLDLLAFHSARVADRRILDAVLPVLADQARGVSRRRAALKTVVKLVAHRKWISDDVWVAPARFTISTSAHATQVAGPIALATSDRVRAAAAVRAASTADADAELRAVAAWLRRELPAEFGDTCAIAARKGGQPATAAICVPTP